jgi:hypothetical protein
MIEIKEQKKEKEIVNLTKRRPRKADNETNNNLYTEMSNVNNHKSSFFNYKTKNNNNNILINNKKYSFINILKPKAISHQKRGEKECKENVKSNQNDIKSISYISKDSNKKENTSLKKKMIKIIHMIDNINNPKSLSKTKKNNRMQNHKIKYNDWNEEKKIIENVIQNNITMYSIYIISRYNENYTKIGLEKIKLYDKDNKEIFIVHSNSNINNKENENVNYLFNNKENNTKNNKPFISEFSENIYINFYINLKKSNMIKYIKIINYENNDEKISPVKEIKIYHGQKKLFRGILNLNYINIINIEDNQSKNFFSNSTTTRTRGSSSINIIKNHNTLNYNSIINIYTTKKRNNNRSYSSFRICNFKKKNKIQKKQLTKVKSDRNFNKKDITDKISYYGKFISYNNTEIYDNVGYNNNILNDIISNTITYNNVENFLPDNTEFENLANILNSTSIQESINMYKSGLYNFNEKYEDENLPFIKFKIIKLVLTSNYGNKKYIGLTGLEFYDINNKLIDIETAETIGAMPKDLHTIYNLENENRIFENVFNGENNTDDSYNMWVTSLTEVKNDGDEKNSFPYIELSFKDFIYLSKIKCFNYNKKNELDICVKTIDIFLDNKYYKTIYLRKGIGDTINENIIQKEEKITSPKNINNNEKKELYSYSQDITFPIKNEYLNVLDKNIFDNFDFA